MGIIRILPADVAGRIAAGEVIERPASVLKELTENAIDAGATRIRILTEDGGRKLIQVIDNGKGMDQQDAMMCIEAHATSKISSQGDVGQIKTLGFRGEALPSISSVSHFELQTRTADSAVGTEVIVDNGAIAAIRECGCAPGTSIKVGYLFGNLPARRKFLRGANTEDSYMEEMMLLLALSRPDISFELLQNNRTVLRAQGTADIGVRVQMLLGKDAFQAMLPVEYTEDDIHVSGFISRPGFTQKSRREQRIIINGRAAAADTVYFAIREAYDTLIPQGRYPGVVLYLELPPERVDVNVHPSKREVRFREPMRVSAAVTTAIRNALRCLSSFGMNGEETVAAPPHSHEVAGTPDAPLPSRPVTPAQPLAFQPIQSPLPFAPTTETQDGRRQAPQRPAETPAAPVQAAAQQTTKPQTTPAQPPMPADAAPIAAAPAVAFRLLGRVGKEYLAAESNGGIIVINIHSAHQRILFEELLANLRSEHVMQQQLLLPVTLELAPDDARILARQLDHFKALGYTIEPFGGNAFLITPTPANIKDAELGSVMRDIISDLRHDSVTNRQSATHLAQLAARHAVRNNAELSQQDQLRLIERLLRCDMPYADPAGLPTMLNITTGELAKRFKS